MPSKLTERVVENVRALLQTEFPARLTAINAELKDIRLRSIEQYHLAEEAQVTRLPSVFILSDGMDVTLDRPGFVEGLHAITLKVVDGDSNPLILRRKLYRYTRILFEIMKNASTAGWVVTFATPAIDYSPMLAAGGEFVSDARVIVNVKIKEVM